VVGTPEGEVSSSNSDLVKLMFDEVFNKRDAGACDRFFASTYVEHAVAPFQNDEPGEVNGPEHMRGVVEWLVAQFPDITMQVEALVSEGDLVAARVLSEGTNLGKLNGVVPPTNRAFSAHQSHWYRISDGRLAEHWADRDDLGTMVQLGVVKRPGPPS
jgi:predicted ester cyclase